MYHRASLLINILIREPMARTVVHFSISHAFSVAGTTMPRLDCWRSHLHLMREYLRTSDSDYPLSVFPHLCLELRVEMFALISSMWALSPLQQVALRHDGIFTHFFSRSLLRGEGLLGKCFKVSKQAFIHLFWGKVWAVCDIVVKNTFQPLLVHSFWFSVSGPSIS